MMKPSEVIRQLIRNLEMGGIVPDPSATRLHNGDGCPTLKELAEAIEALEKKVEDG